MDKSEYWVLHSAVHYKSPIDILAGSELNIAAWFGWNGPNLTRSELVNVFYRLFQAGDLIATRTDRERNHWFESFVPNKKEVEAALAQDIYFDYGLTSKGGARWETETRADWSLFLNIGIHSISPRSKFGVIISGNDRRLIERVVEDSAKSQGFLITDPVWETMQPWRVTYWKTLSVGHSITYGYDHSKSKTPLHEQEPYPALPTWYVRPD